MSILPSKSKLWILGFYTLLLAFSSFVLLFEFVIPHGGITITDPVITRTTTTTTTTSSMTSTETDGTGTDSMTATSDEITTTTSEETITTTTTQGLSYPGSIPAVLAAGTVIGTYANADVLITIYQIRASNSDVFVADVVVADATVILSAFAFNTFGGSNIVQTVSTMANDHDAIFAINSDYASHYSVGYVIRNGELLRTSVSNRSAIALWADGSVSIFAESSRTAQSVKNEGAWQLWSFGPPLIINGVSVADVNDGLARNAVNNPRSAFGVIDTKHYIFVTVDGTHGRFRTAPISKSWRIL
ncbi:MAG: phosphodiester glycosidase family protein [Bacillus subtilis]|nr:phosphodiester glycosidase family protein [Bacillus subtilis]